MGTAVFLCEIMVLLVSSGSIRESRVRLQDCLGIHGLREEAISLSVNIETPVGYPRRSTSLAEGVTTRVLFASDAKESRSTENAAYVKQLVEQRIPDAQHGSGVNSYPRHSSLRLSQCACGKIATVYFQAAFPAVLSYARPYAKPVVGEQPLGAESALPLVIPIRLAGAVSRSLAHVVKSCLYCLSQIILRESRSDRAKKLKFLAVGVDYERRSRAISAKPK